jgi:cytoskeleton protein RodZ
MQTIGERLEEARKKKGISIREAAEATKVRGDYLQKFESNHFDIGLTEIYTRGFLRTYANFLKVPADRLLNDYAALGRGEARPRQPSREVYGRMDISVSSAGEPSDRAAPPEEGAASAEPARAQPRYPRGGTTLPSGPDPVVIFKYAKWAVIGVIGLLVVWLGFSLVGNRGTKTPPSTVQQTPVAVPTKPLTPATDRAEISAFEVVRVQVWAVDPSVPGGQGAELLPATTLGRGQSISFPKTGPVQIWASAQENIKIAFAGQEFIPSASANKFSGAMKIVLP